MRRRGFLASILAAGVAPAVVGSGILMPVKEIITVRGPFPYTGSEEALATMRLLVEQMVLLNMEYQINPPVVFNGVGKVRAVHVGIPYAYWDALRSKT